MKKVKSVLAALLASAMLLGLAACGGGASSTAQVDEPAPADDTAPAATNDDDNSDDGDAADDDAIVLNIVVTDTQAEGNEMNNAVKMVKEMTGIQLEFTIIPSTSDGEVDRTLVALQAGDSLDLIYGTTAGLKTYYNAGVLEPIDELAAAVGYDFTSVYTDGTLPTYDDGKTYGLPVYSDIWLTFLNTKWFEELDIEIPSADEWTWDKYEEVAKQITDANLTNSEGRKVYGSFMETYNNYFYMLASQKGAQAYNADGSSNLNDPLYREAMEWYVGLGSTKGIQPDITNMKAGTYAWNQFVANDDVAMFVCGGWVASMLSNTEQYARDWECAILPMPYPAGEQPSTLSIPGCYAIPSTSKNKEAAFEALVCLAENMYTLGEGRVPTRKDLTEEEIYDYIDNSLIPTVFVNDAVTSDDIRVAWFDENRALLPEKITGVADSVINDIIKTEGDLYGTGAQDLDTTMEKIYEQAQKAIEDAQ